MYCSAISAGYTLYLWHRAADGIRSGGGRKPAEICRPQMHQQSKQRECPTEYAEHTEPSGREVPPTDRHRCALIRRVWHPAIPTPPITQPNHLWKSVKSVGEYYHAHNQADGERVPTEHAEHTEPSGREVPPTDRHGYAQIRRVWHPAIPTSPITQPNHLWKSVKSVGEYYHAGAAASAAPTKQTERVSHRIRGTHRTFWQRKPPTDRHRCAQIRRVWHPCHTHAANQGVQLSLLHKQNRWHVCSVGALLARLVHLRQVHPLRGTNFCVDL